MAKLLLVFQEFGSPQPPGSDTKATKSGIANGKQVQERRQQLFPSVAKLHAVGTRKWDIQSLDSLSMTTNASCSVLGMAAGSKGAEDDLGLLNKAKRPHLSEVT
jgi:hypothetical protein